MNGVTFEFSHRQEIKAARNDLILMTAASTLAIVILLFVHNPNPRWRVSVLYSVIILGMGVLANLIRLAVTIHQMRRASGNAPKPANTEVSGDGQPKPATHSISINMLSWYTVNITILCVMGFIKEIFEAKEPIQALPPVIYWLIYIIIFASIIFTHRRIYGAKVLYWLMILIVPLSILGYYYSIGTFSAKTDAPDMAKIIELTGLRFPSGARVTNSASYVFIKHYEFIAVVELNPGQTDIFLDDIRKDSVGRATIEISSVDRVFRRGYHISRYVPEPDWWDADSVQKSTSAKIEYENAKVELMVSRDDPMKPRVYMVGEGYAGWIPARTATKTNHLQLHSRNGNMR